MQDIDAEIKFKTENIFVETCAPCQLDLGCSMSGNSTNCSGSYCQFLSGELMKIQKF